MKRYIKRYIKRDIWRNKKKHSTRYDKYITCFVSSRRFTKGNACETWSWCVWWRCGSIWTHPGPFLKISYFHLLCCTIAHCNAVCNAECNAVYNAVCNAEKSNFPNFVFWKFWGIIDEICTQNVILMCLVTLWVDLGSLRAVSENFVFSPTVLHYSTL